MAEHNREEKTLLRRVKVALDESFLLQPIQQPVVRGLARAVARFRAENRNRAGVTREAGRRTKKLLERVLLAIRDAKEHQDGEVVRQAKQLVRSAQHETFEELEDRGRDLYNQKRAFGHQRKERLQREQAWRKSLDDGTELAEVPTSDSLRSVGRALDLCVARSGGDGRGYHARLRDGESKFYTLSKGGALLWLAELDMNTDTIVGISAQSNGHVKLQRKQAVHILEVLEATADEERAFAGVGAFGTYLFGGEPDARMHLGVNECTYRVDIFADEGRVVVRERNKPRRWKRWSLFQRGGTPSGRGLDEWCAIYWDGIDLGQFAVLLHQPKVADKISHLFG